MDLRISTLLNAYRNGTTTPRTVIENILKEMDKAPSQIWISRLSRESLEKYLEPLENCKTIKRGEETIYLADLCLFYGHCSHCCFELACHCWSIRSSGYIRTKG